MQHFNKKYKKVINYFIFKKKFLELPYKLYFLYGVKNIIYKFNKKLKNFFFYYLKKKFLKYNFLNKKKIIFVTKKKLNCKNKYNILLKNKKTKKKILKFVFLYNAYFNNIKYSLKKIKKNKFLFSDIIYLMDIKNLYYYLKLNIKNSYYYNKNILINMYEILLLKNKSISYILINYLIKNEKNCHFPFGWY
ncbi:hypothetical protein ACWNYQ_00610 [Candidatus Vidania fulgoroideorum]